MNELEREREKLRKEAGKKEEAAFHLQKLGASVCIMYYLELYVYVLLSFAQLQ